MFLAAIVLSLLVSVFLIARFSGLFDMQALRQGLSDYIGSFSGSPLGPIVLALVFCGAAFLAVPQFVLIGVAVIGFGPVWGSVWAWTATLVSGALTYWVGRFSAAQVLKRASGERFRKFRSFISRNAFAASAIVRNVPTGPFLFVNMMFGALRASFPGYLAGMAVGIVPKILVVGFGVQAIEAALRGRLWMAIAAAILAIGVFVAGWLYARRRRRKGEFLPLDVEKPVDFPQRPSH